MPDAITATTTRAGPVPWLKAFAAGFLAVLVFHQATVALLFAAGLIPSAPFSMAPAPPLEVPQLVSSAFWGGVWGLVFLLVEPRFPRGAAYWVAAILFGGVALTLVFAAVVAPLKGMGVAPRSVAVGFLVNAAWGLGTAVFLRLLRGAAPSGRAAP